MSIGSIMLPPRLLLNDVAATWPFGPFQLFRYIQNIDLSALKLFLFGICLQRLMKKKVLENASRPSKRGASSSQAKDRRTRRSHRHFDFLALWYYFQVPAAQSSACRAASSEFRALV
eukprot:scaffold463_cov242-Pinguiococcus_pyrenoidosus.AAC.4